MYKAAISEGIGVTQVQAYCIVGAFAVNNSVFGVAIMLAFGVLGFLMEENGIPVAPAILGIVLGPMVEENFVTSMIKGDGSFLAFFQRPISAGLGLLAILVWISPILIWAWHRARLGAIPPGDVAHRDGGQTRA